MKSAIGKKKLSVLAAVSVALILSVMLMTFIMSAVAAESSVSSDDLYIAYCNLSFDNEVCILYAVPTENPGVKLRVWTDADATAKILSPMAGKASIGGVNHTVFAFDGFLAQQMADVVYAEAFVVNEDGTEVHGSLNKYSILQYAYNKLGKTGNAPSTSENLKAMLVAMLNYGSAAQTYKNYRADRLANDEWVQVLVSGGALPDGFGHGLYLPGYEVILSAPETNTDGLPFSHWEDEAGTIMSEEPLFTLTVGNANKEYTAVYETIRYSEGLKFVSNGDGTCYVDGIGTYTDSDVNIPPVSPEGDRVTSIGDHAFENNTTITSVIIPEGVTSIGMAAFYDCGSLTSIKLPDSMVIIGDYALYGTNLVYTEYNNGKYIGNDANPYVCLVDVIDVSAMDFSLSQATKTICYGAFVACSNITNISLPVGMTSIGTQTFVNCTNLTNIQIPNSVTNISYGAFMGCNSLTSITFPDGMTNIGSYAFSDCTNLTNIIFNGTTAQWESITKGSSWNASTGEYTIHCTDGTIAKDGSISACSHATVVIDPAVPPTCTETGLTEGKHCSECDRVLVAQEIIPAQNHQYHAETRICEICGDSPLRFTAVAGGYKVSEFSRAMHTLVIPDTYEGQPVIGINSSVFAECDYIQTVIIGKNVASIGDDAFWRCYGIERLTVVEGNTTFHSENNCIIQTAQRTLVLGCKNSIIPSDGSVTAIGYRAFCECRDLTAITIPEGVTSIGGDAFYKCTSLESIVIPEGVSALGTVFDSCTSLERVTLPVSLTQLGVIGNPFRNCTNLLEIHYNGTEKQWNSISKGRTWDYHTGYYTVYCTDNSFYKTCTDGSHWVFNTNGDGTCSLSVNGQFASTSAVSIPSVSPSGDAVTSIEQYAFGNFSTSCTSLITVVIPNTVTTIGAFAFINCPISTINFNGTIDEWNTIEKGEDWDLYTSDYTIYCTDGTIAKDGTVTSA